MLELPRTLQRLALEIDGWLDLRCPDEALARMDPLLDTPAGRPLGLGFRVRAHVETGHYTDALADLDELRSYEHDPEWLDLTEAWCRKRTDDLPGAVACMERLLQRSHRSAIGHFNLGCYLALQGQTERALEEVTLACGLEQDYRQLAAEEHDLDSLRDDPRFRELIAPVLHERDK